MGRGEEDHGTWEWGRSSRREDGPPRAFNDMAPDRRPPRRREEKPSLGAFRCEACDKAFSTATVLATHRRVVHGDTADGGDSANTPAGSSADGWCTLLDPATGATYYYNSTTQQSSWTWPPPPLETPHLSAEARQLAAVGDALYAQGPAQWKSILGDTKPTSVAATTAATAEEGVASHYATAAYPGYPVPKQGSAAAATAAAYGAYPDYTAYDATAYDAAAYAAAYAAAAHANVPSVASVSTGDGNEGERDAEGQREAEKRHTPPSSVASMAAFAAG